MQRWLSLLLATFLATIATPSLAAPPATAVDATPALGCAALMKQDFTQIPDATTALTATEEVAATGTTPAYCRVTGHVAPQIGFELRLPETGWNGRYFQTGCGGFCGTVNISECGDALNSHYAVAAEDTGHVGEVWTPPLWGADRQMRIDFGPRSAHVVAIAAKAITAAFYGRQPAFSYFRGCSSGGRQGLAEALHFPHDFNGIIVGDPAFPGRLGALENNWDAIHLLDANDQPIFSDAALHLLHDAVIKTCDPLDGLADGIISDPRACHFAPATLRCTAGQAPPACLTPAQIEAATQLYMGAHDSKGRRLTPGAAPYGSELAWDGPLRRSIAESYLRYLGFAEPRPAFRYRDFDFDKDVAAVAPQAALYDPVAPGTLPDLSAFRAAGGRLIAYHGWADPGVPPESLLDLYAKITAHEGGIAAVRDWFRVFMVPGMYHCRGGDAPNTFDMLSAMSAWVEGGTVPDGIMARQFDPQGHVVRTRALYAYPEVARYVGTGDPRDAANWKPASPDRPPHDDIDWLWAPVAVR